MDSQQRGERPEGLWDEAQLVIYTTEVDQAEAEPCTEWAKHLGVVSFSLWARYEDQESEVPIYHRSETGAWLSLSSSQYHPDPADEVSEGFVRSVVNMVNEEVGDGWGDPTEDAFESMTDVEKQIWVSLRWAFLEMQAPEAAGVIDWCQKQVAGDPDG